MRKVTFLILCFALSGCVVKGNFAGLYSYYDRVKSQKPELMQENVSDPCKIAKTETPKIVITDGVKLRKCFQEYDEVIVYIWAPKCKSVYCIPINAAQYNCDRRNAELFIVAEYYDLAYMDEQYAIKRPIFGIDTNHYKTDRTSKYRTAFIKDLTSQSDFSGRFLYFKNGKFVKAFDDFSSI